MPKIIKNSLLVSLFIFTLISFFMVEQFFAKFGSDNNMAKFFEYLLVSVLPDFALSTIMSLILIKYNFKDDKKE
ncbi:TPA: hypothetical protein ACGO2X_001178 [Streptococcus suis]